MFYKIEVLARPRGYYSQIQRKALEIKQHSNDLNREDDFNLAELGSQWEPIVQPVAPIRIGASQSKCHIISTNNSQDIAPSVQVLKPYWDNGTPWLQMQIVLRYLYDGS